MNLVRLLTEPSSFFADPPDRVSITPALGVVLVTVVLEAIRGYLVTRHTIGALPPETRQQAGTILYLSGIGATVAVTLVVWLAIGAAFHVLSTLIYEGEGSFRETLAVTGWGYVPQALVTILSIGVLAYLFFVQGIPQPEITLEQYQQYVASLNARPLIRLTAILGIGGILWSGFVWISGVAAVQEIDESDAFVVVAVPVVVLLSLSLLALL